MKKLDHNDDPMAQFMTKARSKKTKAPPPDPEKRNANRARWADVILEEFQRQTGADFEDAISDLLTDLMHWCDRFGMDFHEELRRAQNHYKEETATS